MISLARQWTRAGVGIALLVLFSPLRAHAHGLEPALLSLRELTPGRFEVVWKSSKVRLPGAEVRPLLPPTCHQTADPPSATDDGDRVRLAWTVDCGATGLAGHTIGVADLDVATIDALLHVAPLQGRTVQTVLTARHPSWTAPVDQTPAALLLHYFRTGCDTAVERIDQLLLLSALLLLTTATPRRLAQAGAAFLIGSALAVALVAAADIAPASRPVGIGIAVSLLVVALQLVRSQSADPSRRRWTSLFGLLFGLLCGSAFAGSVASADVASADAALALLGFGLGTALIQASAVAATALAAMIMRRRPSVTAVAVRGTAYAAGILAVFWCLERLAS